MRKLYYVIFALIVFIAALTIFHFMPAYATGILENPILATPRDFVLNIIGPYVTNIGSLGTVVAGVAATAITKVVMDRALKQKDAALTSANSTIKKLQDDHVTQTSELAEKALTAQRDASLADKQCALTEKLMLEMEITHKEQMTRKQEEIDNLIREKQALESLAANKIISKEEYIH